MKLKIITISSVLMILVLVLSGCSSIFIPNDTVLTVKPAVGKTAVIDSFTAAQPGNVRCFSNKDQYILTTGRSQTGYTVDQYQLSTGTLVNITSSETPIESVQSTEDGFYYLRQNSGDATHLQLIWSTNDKTLEKTVTDATEMTSRAFYAFGKNKAVYADSTNQLVFTDAAGNKTKYALSDVLNVTDIVWSEDNQVGFMTASVDNSDNIGLYQILLKDGRLLINQIDSEVISMAFCPEKNIFAYICQKGEKADLYLLTDIRSLNLQKKLEQSNMERMTFDQGGDRIFYSLSADNVSGIRSTVWEYNLETGAYFQITAPIKLTSDILVPAKKNTLFYSTSEITSMENSKTLQNIKMINKLDYTSPKNE